MSGDDLAFKKQFGTILKLFWFLLKNERVTLAKAQWEGITQGLSFLLHVGKIQYNFLVATRQNQKEGSGKLKTSKHPAPHPPSLPPPQIPLQPLQESLETTFIEKKKRAILSNYPYLLSTLIIFLKTHIISFCISFCSSI